MKKLAVLLIGIGFFAASCMTYNASVKDVSELDQKIEVSILRASFDSNEPEIERITLVVANVSDSTLVFIPEKSFFQDDNGFHFLKIPPINLRANDSVNVPVESMDYYQTATNTHGFGNGHIYFGIGQSSASMGDLNVRNLEIVLGYRLLDQEYTGVYRIDVAEAPAR